MSNLTNLAGLPYPLATDIADLPSHLRSLAEAAEGRMVLRFATAAIRDATVTKPLDGMIAWVGSPGQAYYYTGSAWAPVAPPPGFVSNTASATTAVASYTEVAADTVTFTAPPSGVVLVTVGAHLYGSTATGVSYMSAAVKQGTVVVLDSSDERAAAVYGTARASASTMFKVSGLTAGGAYTATATYRSSATSHTTTYDNRFLRVDPA